MDLTVTYIAMIHAIYHVSHGLIKLGHNQFQTTHFIRDGSTFEQCYFFTNCLHCITVVNLTISLLVLKVK